MAEGDLRPTTAPGLLNAVPGLAAQFREVPDGYWSPDGDATKQRIGRPEVAAAVVVACRCGAEPSCHFGGLLSCPGECGRFFMWTGKRLLVACTPES